MHGILKRLTALAPIVVLLVVFGANPAYAAQTVIDSVDASPNTAQAGDTVNFTDTVTLSGDLAPTGSVLFRMYPSDDCSGTPVFEGSAPLVRNAGTNTSTATFTPPTSWVAVEGDYYWWVSYDGAGRQDPRDDDCDETDQRVVVSPAAAKASPSLTGQSSPNDAVEGEEVDITVDATLTGATSPTGDILFGLFDNPTCDDSDGGLIAVESETLAPGATTAALDVTFTPDAAGTYYWALFYEGDANNDEAESACNEVALRLVVQRAPFEGPEQEPGPLTPVIADGVGVTGFLPATGPAPVNRLAGWAAVVLMLGMAAMLGAYDPRRASQR